MCRLAIGRATLFIFEQAHPASANLLRMRSPVAKSLFARSACAELNQQRHHFLRNTIATATTLRLHRFENAENGGELTENPSALHECLHIGIGNTSALGGAAAKRLRFF